MSINNKICHHLTLKKANYPQEQVHAMLDFPKQRTCPRGT